MSAIPHTDNRPFQNPAGFETASRDKNKSQKVYVRFPIPPQPLQGPDHSATPCSHALDPPYFAGSGLCRVFPWAGKASQTAGTAGG
jgi:hypothetical protein